MAAIAVYDRRSISENATLIERHDKEISNRKLHPTPRFFCFGDIGIERHFPTLDPTPRAPTLFHPTSGRKNGTALSHPGFHHQVPRCADGPVCFRSKIPTQKWANENAGARKKAAARRWRLLRLIAKRRARDEKHPVDVCL